MKKRILSFILCIALLFSAVHFDSVAFGTEAAARSSVDYGAAAGNTAVFNVYFPVPVSNAPEKVSNPLGTECGQLSESNEAKSLVMVVTNYYLSDSGLLWYKVKAAPGYTLPEMLRENPWVFQDNVKSPMGESLILHGGGRNYMFDKNGNAVSSLQIGLYDTATLTCSSTLIGDPTYRWQVLVGDEWVNIAGENTPEIRVNYALLLNALSAEHQAKLRCVSKSGSKTVTGDPVTVTVDMNFDPDSYIPPEKPDEEDIVVDERAMPLALLADGDTPPQAGGVCYVTVQYLFENGTQAANSYIAEVPAGVESPVNVDFPYVQGYLPYYEDKQVSGLSITDTFNENVIYTVYYRPTKVEYSVDIYFQNIENDDYSFYDSRTYEGLTGSQVPLKTQVFEGMTELLHETPTIAADGSTHVEVYYDRLYYMTRVYLDGGYGIYSVYARYGADLQSHLTAPERPGYIFIGWDEYKTDSDADGVPDTGGDRNPDTVEPTVPAKNLAYVALWKDAPTAQVNIVFWGQNPNPKPGTENSDNPEYEYSYISTEELHVKPGIELTYSLDGNSNICGLNEHTHTNQCTLLCGKTGHTHTQACYKLTCTAEHKHEDACYTNCQPHTTHTLSCYTTQNLTLAENTRDSYSYYGGTYPKTAYDRLREAVVSPVSGNVYRYRYSGTNYNYFYLDNVWFYLGTGNTYSEIAAADGGFGNLNNNNSYVTEAAKCKYTHTHSAECLGCGKAEHGHTDYTGSCYTLTCDKHVHDYACYNCIAHTHSASCRFPTFDTEHLKYDKDLWDLVVQEEPVTVNRDGSTVLNVYFNRTKFTIDFYHNSKIYTINERWGANLDHHWPIKGSNGTTYDQGHRWTPTGSDIYTQVLVYIAIMPAESFRLTYSSGTGKPRYYMHYMAELLDGETSSDIDDYEGKYYKELFSVTALYNHLTEAEDFLDLEGYEKVGSDPLFTNGQVNNNGGDVYMYYTQKDYPLEFFSGNTKVRTESVPFKKTLGDYYYDTPPLPENAEEGSLKFVGWCLSPDCSGDPLPQSWFDEKEMPSGSLALYAKWEKQFHDVRIVLEKKEDGNYTADDSVIQDATGKVEKLSILHGNTVFHDSDNSAPPTPDNGLYKFLGWFYMDGDVELMWDFEHHPVVEDTVIYAKWSSEVMVPYTVRYVYQDGDNEIEVAPPLVSSSLAGHSLTLKAKVGNELDEAYRNKYFPTLVSHSIPLKTEDAEEGVTYTFYYQRAESVDYYVHYIDKDTGEELDIKETAEVESPVKKSSEYAVVTETYKYFEGYVPDEYQKSLVLVAYDKDNDENPNHLYFYYTKSVNEGVWFIGHYAENKEVPGQYDTHSSDGDVDVVGTQITAEWPADLSKDGFVFKYATIDTDGPGGKDPVTVHSLDEATAAVTQKGVEIKVYYNRIRYPYKIVYRNKDNGKEIDGLEPKIFSGDDMQPYGKTVSAESDDIETIPGYTYASSSSCTIVKDGLHTTDPDDIKKNIIYVYYTEQTVLINFKVVGPDGCGVVDPESLNLRYDSDLTGTANAVPAENYRFVGWFYNEACTNPIVTTDTLKPNGETLMLFRDEKDGWSPKTYYAKFEPAVADLTIERQNAEADQVFVYEIKNTETNDVITVTVVGSNQVTVHDLPVGKYIVTQKNDWSWRYEDSAWEINHSGPDGLSVTFDDGASKKQWLNGNSIREHNVKGG